MNSVSEFILKKGSELCDLPDSDTMSEQEKVVNARWSLFSIACLQSLFSLFDVTDDQDEEEVNTVSVQAFKKRTSELFSYLLIEGCAPELKIHFTEEDEIEDDFLLSPQNIYDIYLNTGYFYHKNNKVSAIPVKKASVCDITFIKGAYYSDDLKMSGAGLYISLNNSVERVDNEIETVIQMFHLSKQSCYESLRSTLKLHSFSSFDLEDNSNKIEYLNLSKRIDYKNKVYWLASPGKASDFDITLLRKQLSDVAGYEYYLIRKVKEDQFEAYKLKDFQSIGKEYLYLARGILEREGVLPPISYKNEGNLTNISIGYLLPPSEQNFFELYSWPVSKESASFNRVMSTNVFMAFKCVLEHKGYIFLGD